MKTWLFNHAFYPCFLTMLFNHAPCAVCCAERNCTEVQFKCGSDTPSCIPDYQVCDGIPSARAGRTRVKRCAVSMMLLWQLQSFSLALVGNVTLASFVTRSHHLSLNSEPVYCATGKSSRSGSIWVFSDFCEIKVCKH